MSQIQAQTSRFEGTVSVRKEPGFTYLTPSPSTQPKSAAEYDAEYRVTPNRGIDPNVWKSLDNQIKRLDEQARWRDEKELRERELALKEKELEYKYRESKRVAEKSNEDIISRHKEQGTTEEESGTEHNNSVINSDDYKRTKGAKKVMEIDPNDATSYYNMGIAYGKQGDYAQAIKCYKKAIAIAPNYVKAYVNMANAYYDIGNIQAQVTNYKKAAQLGHTNAQKWLLNNGHNW
ncbi:hypothetical protein FACS189452_02470 [Bacteroidia bacterium]|nr:hypothetical protein FACS189452_02470 [Bacteroidia bacterium]